MNEPVKRWITTWPYDLQPTMGSSMIDWTKVEVVPAAYHDAAIAALQAELGAVRAATEALDKRVAWIVNDMAYKAPEQFHREYLFTALTVLTDALSAYRAAMAIRDKS